MFLQSVSSTQETDGHLETRLKILPDGSSGLVLTYEDKEGDWMLVGDVPWRYEYIYSHAFYVEYNVSSKFES